MKLAMASDHGGFALKSVLLDHFRALRPEDLGVETEESVDYPDFARRMADWISGNNSDDEQVFGILICGTGIGISIAANRFLHVRAALCHDDYTTEMARRHNDANVLALGGRVLDPATAIRLSELFLATPFDGGRHARRVAKMSVLPA